jgi:uncharacterized protein
LPPLHFGEGGVRYIKETIMTLISREFQVFVKPAGPACNLHCQYCYYIDKKELYPGESFRMPDDLLEQYIIQLIEATTDGPVFFAWHGGEPLLAGIEFYRKAVTLQRKHLPAGRSLVNGIQTNGTLLNEEWCRFLAEEQFMVGISMDGPEELHNAFRKFHAKMRRREENKTEEQHNSPREFLAKTQRREEVKTEGNGTFDKVFKGYELLLQHGIIPEILCVVHAENVGFPLQVYRFFKSLGATMVTFLPLVVPNPGYGGMVSPESVPAEAFGRFLSVIFDEWTEQDIGKVKIQIFEEALRTAFNLEHTLCIFKKQCGGVPVVEFNGDFYSCDHYVRKDHLLGNISDHSLSWFLDHPEQKAFGEAKELTLPRFCHECEVLDMCNGECPKNRFILTSDGEAGLNYLCGGYKLFFNHCRPFVEAVRQVSLNLSGLQK